MPSFERILNLLIIIKMKNDFKNSWLCSDNIFKRALSVWGHFFLGYLCIGLIVAIPFLFIMLISVIFS